MYQATKDEPLVDLTLSLATGFVIGMLLNGTLVMSGLDDLRPATLGFLAGNLLCFVLARLLDLPSPARPV